MLGYAFACPVIAQSEFVTIQGRQFILNGEEFYPRAMNYAMEFVSDNDELLDVDELFFSPESGYDATVNGFFECDSWSTCGTQLEEHFTKIKDMGFNTVRITALCPYMRRVLPADDRTYSIYIRPKAPWHPQHRVELNTSTFDDLVSRRYFQILRHVLSIAEENDLKVILVCAEDDAFASLEHLTPVHDEDEIDRYAFFLSRLADELKDEPGLLAYDLWNEPFWTKGGFETLSKSEVCEITSLWYDAIAGEDPNHLVTIGGAGLGDVASWDMATMKIDFYSPHFYALPWKYDGYNQSATRARFGNLTYWYGRACPMPWIIGETGFSAEDDTDDHQDDANWNNLDDIPEHHAPPWMDGSESDQAAFADYSMDKTRAYLGSGYSWWNFQNSRSNPISSPETSEYEYLGSFYGLLKYGDGTDPWFDKEAVQTMTDYVLASPSGSLPSQPSTYTNWYNQGLLLSHWYAVDDQTEPLADALTESAYEYRINDGDIYPYDFTMHLSNGVGADGHVRVWNGPPVPGDYCSLIQIHLIIPGHSDIMYTAFSDTPWDGSTAQYGPRRLKFKLDCGVLEVESGSYGELLAWSEVEVCDGYIEGTSPGGSANVVARDIVHVTGEFHIEAGSEAHLWNGKTFPDCNQSVYHSLVTQPTDESSSTRAETEQEDEVIVLRFEVPPSETMTIRPTIAEEQVNIDFSRAAGSFFVVSSDGRKVHFAPVHSTRIILPISGYAAGQYAVQWDVEGKQIVKTFNKVHSK